MCFHAQQTRSASEVQERFQAQGLVSLGVYNGFSHPKVTAICDQAPQNAATPVGNHTTLG